MLHVTHPSTRAGASLARWKLLLLGTALPTLALAITPGRASAQAFNGTPTGPGFTRTIAPGSETITINTPSTIINWTPTELGPVADFLPAGNVATFQNGAGVTDFAVLNRIIPEVDGQVIALNGRVISQLQSAAGTTRGGSVAFYTPNGLIIGSNAVFDVGNLVLTTLDPVRFPLDGSPTRFTAVNPASSITILPGAQINATAANSYVAVLSPRIDMGGAVRVDGSTAYIGAETVDLAINSGLFTIIVTTGSGDATPIVHTGSTGGPASTGGADSHQIAMVAVPKNQAITMLLSGSLGYDTAANAAVENGVITLSSGRNLFSTSFSEEVGPTDLDSSIRFDGGTVTSNLDAQSRGSTVISSSQTAFNATGNVRLLGRSSTELVAEGTGGLITIAGKLEGAAYSNTTGLAGSVRVAALNGGTVSVAGTTRLRTDSLGIFGRPAGAPPIYSGGTATIEALGGTVSFGKDVTLAAEGYSEGVPGDLFGGTVTVRSVDGGNINFAGSLSASARIANFGGNRGNGLGGTVTLIADGGQVSVTGILGLNTGIFGPFDAGNATGGTARLTVRNNGRVTAGEVDINAFGGGGGPSAAGVGGFGTGGTAEVIAESGGTLAVTNQLLLNAGGFGSPGPSAGGNGTAGSTRISASGNAQITAGTINLTSSANGGQGTAGSAPGGSAQGGTAEIRIDGGSSRVSAPMTTLNASANGGVSTGGRGGDAAGGQMVVEATGGGAADFGIRLDMNGHVTGGGGLTAGGNATGGVMQLRAATGGTISGAPFFTNIFSRGGDARDAGGNAQGGFVIVTAEGAGSSINLGTANASMFAQAQGGTGTGAGSSGGDANGGSVQFLAGDGGLITVGSFSTSPSAFGGAGVARTGSAQAGTATIRSDGGNSRITATTFSVLNQSSTASGPGAVGGSATGGTTDFIAENGGEIAATGNISGGSEAFGGSGTTGGNATAGTTSLTARGGGRITAGGMISASATASGGGGSAGNGGNATGGSVLALASSGGRITATTISLNASANGGNGGGAGNGGTAQGGQTDLLAEGAGSQVTASTGLAQNSNGAGGSSPAARGGNGAGGRGRVQVTGGGRATIGTAQVSARGTGGFGGAGGGVGQGAGAELRVSGAGSVFTATATVLSSTGFGGSSSAAAGGAGIGADLLVDASATAQIALGTAVLDGSGVGGSGSTSGGNGTGGSSRVHVVGGSTATAGTFSMNSSGQGGTGASVAGGAALGSLAEVRVADNASSFTATFATISTNGLGGASTNGAGGGGMAGRARLDASAAGQIGFGLLTLNTLGTGGEGLARGGDGSAGIVELVAATAGRIAASQMRVNGLGRGGNARDIAGVGRGATITLSAVGPQSVIDLGTGASNILGNGFGGNATTGGQGTGGSTSIIVDQAGLLRTAATGSAIFDASGTGGNSVGTAVGTGGAGIGGATSILVDRGGLMEVGRLDAFAAGVGGLYQAAAGGSGGDGTGGNVQVTARAGGTIRTINPSALGLAFLGARAFGGNTTVAGSRGGNALGGTTSVSAIGGTIDILQNIQVFSFATGGASPFQVGNATGGTASLLAQAGGSISATSVLVQGIAVTPATAGTGGEARGGSASIVADGGTITLPVRDPNIVVQLTADASATASGAGGDSTRGGNAIGGTARIAALAGGSITATASPNVRALALANATAGGGTQAGDATAGTALVEATSGAGQPTSTLNLRALEVRSNATAGAGTSGGGAVGGTSRVQAQRGSISISQGVDVSADAVSAASPATTRFGGVSVELTDTVATLGGLTMQSRGAQPRVFSSGPALASVALNNSTLSILGNGAINSGGSVLLQATGASTFDVGGNLTISVGDDVTFAASGAARFNVGGGLTVTGGANSDILVTHASRPANEATIRAGTVNFVANDIDTRGAVLKAANGIALTVFDDLSVGDLEADGTIALALADTPAGSDPHEMLIAGRIAAPQITIRSADLAIASTGQVGARGITQSVTLTVASDRQTVIGGDATPARQGYTLDRSEIGRIGAASLRVDAPAAGGGAPLLVRDVNFTGSANHDGFRSVELATAGTLRVEGAVTYSGAATDDQLTLRAARIEIPVPTSSVRIRDAAGAPSGVLLLSASDIAVATADLLGRLDAMTPSARNAALRTNDGSLDPRGYVEAGTVRLAVGNSVAVQNSGTIALVGGITTGPGGLVVERSGSLPIMATLFGARLAGGQITGGDAFFDATFGKGVAAGTFTDESELNLINVNRGTRTISRDIAAPSAAAITASLPPPTDFDQLALEQDGAEEGGGSSFGSARQYLVDLTALSRDELIEEPVAGSSDSTIWGDEEEDEEEEEEEGSEAPEVPADGGGN